jgi:hypothetical protein
MDVDCRQVIVDFVEYVMPELKPHETAVYLFLLTKSHLHDGSASVRVGQRAIAPQYGRGKQGAAPARNQLIAQLKKLEAKGCIAIGDTTREGTLYHVVLPREIPFVITKLVSRPVVDDDDYFTDTERRRLVYERDKWTCGYCGDKVNAENASIDHIIPQSKGGTHRKDNLRTACLICNSIKSGKTEAEAAVALLQSVRDRRRKGVISDA